MDKINNEQQKIIKNLINNTNKINNINNQNNIISYSETETDTEIIINNVKNNVFNDFINDRKIKSKDIFNQFINVHNQNNKLNKKEEKKEELNNKKNDEKNNQKKEDELKKHIIQMMEVSNEYCDYEKEYLIRRYDCNSIDKYLLHYEKYMNYKLVFNSNDSEKLFIRLINADEEYINRKYKKNLKELIYKMFKIKDSNKKIYYSNCEENKDKNPNSKSHTDNCKCKVKVKSVVNLSINTFIRIINEEIMNLESKFDKKETIENFINIEKVETKEEKKLDSFYKSVDEFIKMNKNKINENTKLIKHNNKDIISCLNLLHSVKNVLGMNSETTSRIIGETSRINKDSYININLESNPNNIFYDESNILKKRDTYEKESDRIDYSNILELKKDRDRYNFNFDSDLNLDTVDEKEDFIDSDDYINESKNLKRNKKQKKMSIKDIPDKKIDYDIKTGKVIDKIIDDIKFIKEEIIFYNKNNQIEINNLENIKRISHYKILLNDLKQRIKINTNDNINNDFNQMYNNLLFIRNENYLDNIKNLDDIIDNIKKNLLYRFE